MAGWLGVGLATATAIATSVTAYVVWRNWRGSIHVEWEPVWEDMYPKSIPPMLEIRLTVRNNRQFAVSGQIVEITQCPVLDVKVGDRRLGKHGSWKPNQAPLRLDVEPGGSESCTVFVVVNWISLAKRKSVKRRPKSSTKLRVQISIFSKARRRRMTKARTIIAIPNETTARAATAAKT